MTWLPALGILSGGTGDSVISGHGMARATLSDQTERCRQRAPRTAGLNADVADGCFGFGGLSQMQSLATLSDQTKRCRQRAPRTAGLNADVAHGCFGFGGLSQMQSLRTGQDSAPAFFSSSMSFFDGGRVVFRHEAPPGTVQYS